METLIKSNNSVLLLNSGALDSLRDNLEFITEMDLSIALSVLNELNIKKEEKDKIYNYLDSIKKLLTLNKEEHTTYEITNDQLAYVELFFKKVDELAEKNKQQHLDNLKKIAKLNSIRSKYGDLLVQIEDSNNKKYISDLNLISLLLNEYELENAFQESIKKMKTA